MLKSHDGLADLAAQALFQFVRFALDLLRSLASGTASLGVQTALMGVLSQPREQRRVRRKAEFASQLVIEPSTRIR